MSVVKCSSKAVDEPRAWRAGAAVGAVAARSPRGVGPKRDEWAGDVGPRGRSEDAPSSRST